MRELQTVPYIENVPDPRINYVETGDNTYSKFTEEEKEPRTQPELQEDKIWHMQFDGASSIEGNGVGIVLLSPLGKPHQFSFQLNFQCTNNIAKFEALSIGLQKDLELG